MAQFRKDTHQFLNDGRTIFETVMLADQYGNIVGAANPTGMAVDAFGRARITQPLTLFDYSSRYVDDGSFVTSNTSTATYSLNTSSASIELKLDTTSDAEIVRETTKVFVYQPGKSIQILNSFVMNEAKENLRQRVGYFSTQNGIFLEQDGTTINIVKRSYTNGSIVETKAEQSTWNIDKLDGTGPSLKTLDLSKAQIFFTDIEWLGVGSVRTGFVIDGSFIHCHSFHHANEVTDTYMSTATLPIRLEIKNTGATSSNSTLKQICSTVISEGGYNPTGKKFSVGYAATKVKDLPTANTYYPILSIKLKNARRDTVVLPRHISLVANGNNTRVNYRIVTGSDVTLTNSSFVSVSSDSAVEYDISANAVSGGRTLSQGYALSTTQASVPVDLLDGFFDYQLERNTLANTEYILVIQAAGATNGDDVITSIDWEEVI